MPSPSCDGTRMARGWLRCRLGSRRHGEPRPRVASGTIAGHDQGSARAVLVGIGEPGFHGGVESCGARFAQHRCPRLPRNLGDTGVGRDDEHGVDLLNLGEDAENVLAA